MSHPSSSNSTASTRVQVGPGFVGLCVLASLVLAILKLTEILSISWLIVCLPLIVGLGFTVVMLVLAVILLFIAALVVTK